MLAHSRTATCIFMIPIKISSLIATTSSISTPYTSVRRISVYRGLSATSSTDEHTFTSLSSSCYCRTASTSSKPPQITQVTFSDPILEGLKLKSQIRCALELHEKTIIKTSEYETIALEATGGAMSSLQAREYLTVLAEAGEVILVGDDVYLRPIEVINEVFAEAGVPKPINDMHPSDAERYRILCDSVKDNEVLLQGAAIRAARHRQRIWSGVALVSGAQMALFAYLTFLKYDWDIMEPITYFVSLGTAIVFYLFCIVYKRHHSLYGVDETFLSNKLQKEAMRSSVDLDKLQADLEEMDRIAAEAKSKKKE
eukprot:Tbor_TRINITY_DN4930_c0_g1::TRINITY_DN4930_c0_g1_i1::g.9656::m.9656/K20858/MCU; calcium uniporter protein, mitochondrial